MKALHSLTEAELSEKIKTLVAHEKKLTIEILWHLREIERRRLYAKWAYPSLFEYCVKDLGYSESAAVRRISAMRLLKEMPEIEEALTSGALNLSQVSQAQEYFKKEQRSGNELPKEEKTGLLREMVGKSTRECERLIAKRNPALAIPSEKERVLTEELTEIRIVVSKELLAKIERLKEIKSHLNPNFKHAELFEHLIDAELKKHELKITPKIKPSKASSTHLDQRSKTPPPAPEVKPTYTRFIPADLKRAVYAKDQGRCTFQDPHTQKNCGSRHQLQIDHIEPLAFGGKTEIQNLRLRCRTHNLQEAIHRFGPKKMDVHLR